jgi:DNA-binding transcriptional MerR regulator
MEAVMVTLLESGEAARIAGCSRETLVADAEAGRIEIAFRTGNGRRLFDRAVVEAYARERRERRERQLADAR